MCVCSCFLLFIFVFRMPLYSCIRCGWYFSFLLHINMFYPDYSKPFGNIIGLGAPEK